MDKNNNIFEFYNRVFQFSVFTLPYLFYFSLCGLFTVIVVLLKTLKRTALDALTQSSLWIITGLLTVSSIFAFNKGEAFLQLTNFLPFFALFSILPFLLQNTEKLEQVIRGLVLATIPINIISLLEYIIKSPFLPISLQNISLIHQIRSAPHVGRAMVMFNHPNVLASYLVLVLGLGLGFLLKTSHQTYPTHLQAGERLPALEFKNSETHKLPTQTRWLTIGTYLSLIGLFCSGSRNGILVAISQLLMFSLLTRANRIVLTTVFGSLLGVAAGVMLLGIGGRVLSTDSLAADPRMGVWQIAIALIRERPWLGWGLGNYKFLYQQRLIDPQFPYIAHPHNFWLLMASEAGIPVAIALTLLVGFICYRAVRLIILKQLDLQTQSILLGYLFAFWGCFAFALFDVTLYDARINVLNWVILGGIYAVTQWEVDRRVEQGASDC
jgi:O-antigen ligase